MNPAALKANIGDLPARRHAHRQHRRVHQAQPRRRSATTSNPLEDDSLERLQVHKVAMATLTRGALEPTGHGQEGRRAREEHVRARPAVVDVPPAAPTAPSGSCARSSPRSRTSPRPTSSRSGPAGTTARPPRASRSPTRWRPAKLARRHVPADHRQHGAGLRHRRRRAAVEAAGVARHLPDHAGLGHPARAVASTRTSASRRSRPRTRSPASARRSARRTAARWASRRRPVRVWR